ncbi:MAG: glycosyltransferase family 92 protein [Marinosulfonomonas sp.]|nr:glycosyltransferase family 92 protein [Marinosulfonomonas sp.]
MYDFFKNIGRRIAIFRDRQASFSHELAVCAIFKNEALYLQEWLIFHHGVGVDHFYLYNDASTDDYAKVLQPWIERGIVTVKSWPKKAQVAAYNHCIRNFRTRARWIAFIDLDEFLYSPTGRNLPELLENYRGVAAIFVYWVLFGSSGHAKRPMGSVIQAYQQCLDLKHVNEDDFNHGVMADKSDYVTGWSRDGKSIVNPRQVRKYNIHKPKKLWFGEILDENRDPARQRVAGMQISYAVFRINHYWSKSIDELTAKVDRGSICNPSRPQRDLVRWLEREKTLNVATDGTIQPVWHRIQTENRKSTGAPA